MQIAKLCRVSTLILAVGVTLVACGVLFDGKKDKDDNKVLDSRIPQDWDGVEDWEGSEWEVISE